MSSVATSPNKRRVVATVTTRTPHAVQHRFQTCGKRRIVVRGGRRGGKTVGLASYSVDAFLDGARVLYAAPTADQLQTYWFEVTLALRDALDKGMYVKHEGRHSITRPGTKQRIRAKTAWNADTLRGDYADVLIFDEYQMMHPEAWTEVGAPMLLDNDGTAVFIYTPPKPHDKAVGYRHAAELYKRAQDPENTDWAAFHFTSHDNPYISKQALERIVGDMSADSYRREILAEDSDEVAGALWTRELLNSTRVSRLPRDLVRVAVGVDPPGGATECGIVVVAASPDGHVYIFGDASLRAGPERWAAEAVKLAVGSDADIIVGEKNYGGDMVEAVLRPVLKETSLRYRNVNATRGKAIRAEPVVAKFERGEAHVVGSLGMLEDELCTWVPGSTGPSPNRLDAMVWAAVEVDKQKRRRPGVSFG